MPLAGDLTVVVHPDRCECVVKPVLQVKLNLRPQVVVAPLAGLRHSAPVQGFLRHVLALGGCAFETDGADRLGTRRRGQRASRYLDETREAADFTAGGGALSAGAGSLVTF